MEFCGDVDLGHLPFEDRSADAVVSQFGLEYAGLATAMAEAGRVCRTKLLALVHAREGEVCGQAREQVAQVDWLLGEFSLEDRLTVALVQNAPELIAAIEVRIAERARHQRNTLVLDGTRAFVNSLHGGPPAGPAEARNFTVQLGDHAQRMRAMVDAAPAPETLEEAVCAMRGSGFTVSVDECGASGHLVGHWVEAQRASV